MNRKLENRYTSCERTMDGFCNPPWEAKSWRSRYVLFNPGILSMTRNRHVGTIKALTMSTVLIAYLSLLINRARYLSRVAGLSHATTAIIRREENRIRVICHTG